jgi:hypothetical protein
MLTMTPQARAIAAFTLAAMALIGWLNRLAFAAYLTFGGELPAGDGSQLVFSLLGLAVAGGAFWFAHSAAGAGAAGWETDLAQAGRVIAALALVVAVLATVGVFTGDQSFYSGFMYTG